MVLFLVVFVDSLCAVLYSSSGFCFSLLHDVSFQLPLYLWFLILIQFLSLTQTNKNKKNNVYAEKPIIFFWLTWYRIHQIGIPKHISIHLILLTRRNVCFNFKNQRLSGETHYAYSITCNEIQHVRTDRWIEMY